MIDETWDSDRRPSADAGDDQDRGHMADDVERSDEPKNPGSPDGASTRSGTLRVLGEADLAPVIPLFRSAPRADREHPSRRGAVHDAAATGSISDDIDERPSSVSRPRLSVVGDPDEGVESSPDRAEARERAEAVLLRKLRSRSLSLAEARTVIRGVDDADDAIADELIDHFVDLGYLDDAAFAEQLAMSAVERKGEGRRAVAETLRKRGIPRDIAEAALAELPDDDAERALDFARSKVRGVDGAEYDAALRRLAGQLARRGYPSSVALTAARTALEEAGIGRSRSFPRPSSGVRFTPDR
ncbi:regulatory protein RecX [Microbacterium testaceum]|nr:regulatory protein RecX [Microbacterium testaceum]